MRIGLTIRTFYPRSGGMQAHAERLVHELRAKGHEVVVVTRSVSHTPSYWDYFFFSESIGETEINGLRVCVLRHARIWNGLMWIVSKCTDRPRFFAFGIWLFNLIFARQTIAALRDVDVIHHVGQAHELIGFAAAAAARALDVPFLVQPTLHPGQWGDSDLDFYLYRQAHRLLVHTEYERDTLKRYRLTNPFDVVGNGIEDRADGKGDRFRQAHSLQGPIVLFLGRKESDKGYSLVKQAFSKVRLARPDATLVCMGPSPRAVDPTQIEDQEGVLELGFGHLQEKHDALAACTALCVPSEGESFGLVYMEAGRYAKPAIGRRLPVLEELLGRKEAALLVGQAWGEGNQIHLEPDELADAILTLLNDPAKAERLGSNAYYVSEAFLWSNVGSRFEKSYWSSRNDLNQNRDA